MIHLNSKKLFNTFIFTAMISTFMSLTVTAQQDAEYYPYCNLKLGTGSYPHFNPPPANFSQIKTTVFDITFVNTTPEVETAVWYAADIWSSILVSAVPVNMIVKYYPVQNFYGQCVPNLVKNFPGAPVEDVWYFTSLADVITGTDQNPGEFDCDIILSSSADWYYSTDGKTPSNKVDLVSVILHEMGHALGYLSLGKISGGIGSYGYITTSDLGRPIEFEFKELLGLPTVYDKRIKNGDNKFITDTLIFPNQSTELAGLFTGNDLYFDGEFSADANGNIPAKLHAENPFRFASSLLHLDEDSYPTGNPNELMTPYISSGAANHNPGPVTVGLLKDLGWTVNDSVAVEVKEADITIPEDFILQQNYPNPFNPVTKINFTVPAPANMTDVSIRVKLVVFNSLGQQIAILVDEPKYPGFYEVEFDGNGLSSGIYFYGITVNGKTTGFRKMTLMK
jgi:hypothetical protein